ncbi:MAG: cytochrome c3 family protein [Burkholderiaceae bacterium]
MVWGALLGLCLGVSAVAQAQGIESILAPGRLIQGHAKTEDNCNACHIKFDRNAQDGQCKVCHKEVGADMRNAAGYHGRLKPQACRICHTDHKGREAKIIVLNEKQFDHSLTDFGLRGKHQKTECSKCHVPEKKYRDAALECNACHRKDDVHKGGLGPKCADCHTEENWKETRFDHGKTRFALTGKHIDVKCVDCHKNNRYKDTVRTCVGCHKKDDKHKGSLGEQCSECHNERGWKDRRTFDHDKTDFPLLGKHAKVQCKECHTSTKFKEAPKECIGCHRKDDKHERTLGEKCADCHSERDWKTTQGRFDHDRTKFKLRNSHAPDKVKCNACHKDLRSYRNTPLDCYSCHKKDDKHEGQQGRACEKCHNDSSWKVDNFDHARTRFALTGRHLFAKCKDCHVTPRHRDAPRECYACHKKDDKHKLKLGERCESCHSTRAWSVWDFDHDKRTPFRLDGAHRKITCEACHKDVAPKGKDAAPLAVNCIACHRRDDAHDGQFGVRCDQCHSTSDWKKIVNRRQGRFDAPGDNRWSLAALFGQASLFSRLAGADFHEGRRP